MKYFNENKNPFVNNLIDDVYTEKISIYSTLQEFMNLISSKLLIKYSPHILSLLNKLTVNNTIANKLEDIVRQDEKVWVEILNDLIILHLETQQSIFIFKCKTIDINNPYLFDVCITKTIDRWKRKQKIIPIMLDANITKNLCIFDFESNITTIKYLTDFLDRVKDLDNAIK